MEEHEHGQGPLGPGRADNLQGDRLTVDLDRPLADFDAREVDFHRGLGAGQDCPGITWAQLFQGTATAGGKGIEECLGVVLDAGAAGGEGLADAEGEEGGGQGLLHEVHGEILLI